MIPASFLVATYFIGVAGGAFASRMDGPAPAWVAPWCLIGALVCSALGVFA